MKLFVRYCSFLKRVWLNKCRYKQITSRLGSQLKSQDMRYMKTENENSAGNRHTLAILRDLVFIIAIYFYFMGWAYAFYLFNHFGISLNSINIPFYYFFVYSYSVIMDFPAIIVAVVALIVIYLITSCAPIYLRKWSLALLLIILFPTFFWIAKERY